MKQQEKRQPLNILQVASGFPAWGGTELHILNLSRELTLRGHNVTVACRPNGWVAQRAAEMGLQTLDATVRRQQDWRDFAVFDSFCRSKKIDVLHTHWSTDAFVPAVAARLAGVPVRLMTRHSPYPFKTAAGRYLYSNVLFNRLLAVSQSVATTLIDCGISKDKVSVIHHGTNVAEFEKITTSASQIRSEIGLRSDDVAVGIVGRIAEEKGHKYLYDALTHLLDLKRLRVVVVGEGSHIEEQHAYLTELGLTDQVVWVPFRSDVNNVINALDIVAVPSIWQEPCSAVIQQAMALSKPVIGTRVGGTPEMIVDGVTGLLADARNASQLADAIRRLVEEPEIRIAQGVAGAKRVRELFTLERMTSRIEDAYYQEFARSGRLPSASRKDHRKAVPA